MTQSPCPNCVPLLEGTTNMRHPNLERSGLQQSMGYHGSRDDEYVYVCNKCGSRFIGDSMGTWPDKN